jgi:hypothetical protein
MGVVRPRAPVRSAAIVELRAAGRSGVASCAASLERAPGRPPTPAGENGADGPLVFPLVWDR